MFDKREVKDRDAMNPQGCVIHLCFFTQFDRRGLRVELPLGIGQLARSDVAVMYQVRVGSQLVHDLTGEEKWRG
jgi:hypothetical protein